MIATSRCLLLAFTGSLTLGLAFALSQEPPSRTILLNVGKGQLPPDTGMDDKT